jgi:TRAP-type mannitol/chloroaromatic compound transport system substrate-binding protein
MGNFWMHTFPASAPGRVPIFSIAFLGGDAMPGILEFRPTKQEETSMTVTRRQFIPTAAAASLAAAAASPAFGQQTSETLKWRLTSSFPKGLDTLFGASQTIARVVGELTDGKLQLEIFAAGEIVPGLQVLDAVGNGTVECGHTYTGYYIGKNPSFIFDGSVPFGLTPRQHNAWLMFGDGRKLMDEVYDSFGVVGLTGGNTGGQMFGWFRKEIKTPKDFEGLKIRTAGFGGKVLQKLGAVPQQIAGGEIYQAMERGAVDACEWVGPYDDEKLGFNKVAKYYYTPGVMELEAHNILMVNKAAWAALPPRYQAVLRYAGIYAMTEMLASYDAKNAQAIARLVASGTQLSVLPEDVIKALRGALEAVLDEEAAGNEQFKRILANWRKFRAEQHRWFSIADTRADLAVYRTGA